MSMCGICTMELCIRSTHLGMGKKHGFLAVRTVPTIKTKIIFCTVFDYVRKADVSAQKYLY